MDYDELMRRARAVNRKRDEADRKLAPLHDRLNKQGAPIPIEPGAPSDLPIIGHLQVAMSAIEAGIKVGLAAERNGLPAGSWNILTEGLAMLEEIEQRLRNQRR